ncbi:LacI family DNA-binding transcriptional regulator [Pseudoalteromonas fuliginea]|uniref:LacI family DNA-binding transcriptional regulator n=1 Tax=Pseudoalteromonas fuliginea TaxID=1872678 RepID=A0AB73BBR2_9GAMM|nr:LacI family DNA-binding transcriptional regulator [Pseudoalteromonas fuliginea]KAA1156822.1 LacI family DNA-binding transcriptional regulator [Pseudoalteromonas fuliginea]
MQNRAKSVTIFDVADLAGVSKSTVSLVLTQSDKVGKKSKQKVLKAIDELGYIYNRDAAAMRSRRSNLVAIVINDLTNPYMAQLATNLERILNENNLQAMIVSSNNNLELQTNAVKNLKEYNAAAFIICPVANTCAKWLDTLSAQQKVMTLMREVPFSAAPCVLPDYKKASHVASMHLLAQGVTHIAFIGSELTLSDSQALQSGFNTACSQHGVTPLVAISCSQNQALSAKNAFIEAYAKHPQLSALVCENDIIAQGVFAAIQTLNIPTNNNIKIASCYHLPYYSVMPYSLSTVVINTHDIAKRCHLVLKELLQNTAPPVKTLINVNSLIRDSSQ